MRERLPNRRPSMTIDFDAGVPGYPLHHFTATMGYHADGRLGEVFLHASKTGSDRDIAVSEAAILLSFALQHGVPPEAMRDAMPRTKDGSPEGPVGALLDRILSAKKKAA